ncbi:histidine--tRNA ligase [Candidatus Woesebacteria bacterium RBG_16_36_11]|uniref:Histidine--tRNA ligase n=3 Tax=Candidatus Woeseibacteriota TaxID=1752722 RepID=A0A1F7XDJ6_9BACT|nr:MAG: histidine--tRNA ligase [Candidatus Woesebacteria bacterium RBG_13_36_22]OGM12488.1 MAG: histidine--tRNA ligase [Candidatus Woesebacteria bacterium RBG_16_36_11]OGM17369.1 MAG: histidine--tRNA ligase [Candidatus Woesebacteria bacterium RBG_19FT_COMBO_37_29]
MDKSKTRILKGFRDFLPEKMYIRNRVISILREVFESFGFSELATPTLEYQEVLLGKYGEEAEKLMYLFKDQGERGVGLKYDLTVPLSRVMADYPNLPIPFKRYQIQPIFRAEKPQKGRYREVYQCDVDTIGSSSNVADAEILAIISTCLNKLNFTDYKIRLNSRKVLFNLIEKAGIKADKSQTILRSIDKLDKKNQSEVEKELADKGLSKETITKLFANLKSAEMDDDLKEIISLANKMGAKNIEFDPILVRGLDYYTGSIFETVVKKPKIGSITGGGRFDNLIEKLGGPDLPAVGTTIGLDRICDCIEELNLWPNIASSPTKVLVTVFSKALFSNSLDLAKILRNKGINCELYPSLEKLDKQLKYADKKGIPWVIIIGSDEAEKEVVTLKNLEAKSQDTMKLEKAIDIIKAS